MNLSRDSHGRLVLQEADGTAHAGVVPVRAFPLTDPDGAISLVGSDGRERLWVADPAALPETARALLAEELARREFAPVIERLLDVSTFSTPSTWSVRTDRGDAQLVLKGEEDIRRLDREKLLIADTHGIQYLVRNLAAMDRISRKILDRFL